MTSNIRISALAKFLGVADDEIIDEGNGLLRLDNSEDQEYLVLMNDEANGQVSEYIKDSVEFFNPDFLSEETGIDGIGQLILLAFECDNRTKKGKNIRTGRIVYDIIEKTCGFNKFVEDAIDADGRGHFLASYDEKEHEVRTDHGTLFIYRVN